MDSSKRVLIIGGGIFGLTTAIVLGEHKHKVTVAEKTSDFLRGASFVNQNRLHMGYHYPRSKSTVLESYECLDSFRSFYGEAEVTSFDKYYAIARDGSLTSADEFYKVFDSCGIPLREAWPDQRWLNRQKMAACWKAPETIFDYHLLRKVVLRRLMSQDVRLLRNATVTDIVPGPPHDVEINHSQRCLYDVVINATYGGITDLVNMLHFEPLRTQFELTMMPIMEASERPEQRLGITVMDGPFGSLMPRGLYERQFILAHVTYTPTQRIVANQRPKWQPMEGFPELRLIEASAELFPIVNDLEWRETWITTKIVLPDHDFDDARPTLLIEHAPRVFSLFSGKLHTCVKYAFNVLRVLEQEYAEIS